MPVPAGALLAAQLLPVAVEGFSAIQTAAKRRAAEAALEAQVAKEKPNESILDFYNKAYNRYAPNAYQSAEYNAQMRNILSNQATGINALQERRSALAGIPSIVQGTNVASQRAAAGAEAAQRANLGMLGQATSAKAGEENRIRQMKLNLMAQKAGQLAQTGNIQGTAALKGLENAAIMGYYMNKDVSPTVGKTAAKTTSDLGVSNAATPGMSLYNLYNKRGNISGGKLSPFATKPDYMSAWDESEYADDASNYLNNPYFRK
jgi:hypothetical protein